MTVPVEGMEADKAYNTRGLDLSCLLRNIRVKETAVNFYLYCSAYFYKSSHSSDQIV